MSTEGVNRYEFYVITFCKCSKITTCQTFDLDISPPSAPAKQTRQCDRPHVGGHLRHPVNCSKMLTCSELEASPPLCQKLHAVGEMGRAVLYAQMRHNYYSSHYLEKAKIESVFVMLYVIVGSKCSVKADEAWSPRLPCSVLSLQGSS